MVNETSLRLEWRPPQEGGGRDDLVYNVICKSCGSGRGGCTRCGDNVQFVPRQLGLTDTHVHVSDLLAHTRYTFEVQAVNGVSEQSPSSPRFASVNITTNQAGQAPPPPHPPPPAVCSSSHCFFFFVGPQRRRPCPSSTR